MMTPLELIPEYQEALRPPEDVLQRAGQEWIWAENREYAYDVWCNAMAPHRDHIKRVFREIEIRNSNADSDDLRKRWEAPFERRLNDLQKEILGRIVEEHSENFDDPWLELRRAADLFAGHTSRQRGQRRRSKDPAAISTTGLRAAARVIEKWWRSQGHGWTYGECGEPPKLSERVLLQAARLIDPNVTATHVRSVMKNPD